MFLGTKENPKVFLSQRDIRELQFAKASIATGWDLLVEELKIDPKDILLISDQTERPQDDTQSTAVHVDKKSMPS